MGYSRICIVYSIWNNGFKRKPTLTILMSKIFFYRYDINNQYLVIIIIINLFYIIFVRIFDIKYIIEVKNYDYKY